MDFTVVIRLDPKDATAYANRGGIHAIKRDLDRALKDLNDAIRLKPASSQTYLNRAGIHICQKNYHQAVDDLQQAVKLDPKEHKAHANLAYLLSCCPRQDVRNGKRAVECARKACELTEWMHPVYFFHLSVAYAEDGQFQEATRRVKRVLESS